MPKNDHRQIEVMTNETVRGVVISRYRAFVRIDTVAAIVEINEGGPTRLIFTGGGFLDICGSAEIIRRKIRIAELNEHE